MEAAQLAQLVQQLIEMRTELAEGRLEREALREQLRAQEQRAPAEGLRAEGNLVVPILGWESIADN